MATSAKPNAKSVGASASSGTPKASHTKENRKLTAGTPAAAARTPASSKRAALEEIAGGDNTLEALNQRMLEMEAALKKAEADKATLARKLANAVGNPGSDDEAGSGDVSAAPNRKKAKETKIPRPKGDFNIQEAMGLAGTAKKRKKYTAILRVVKEVAGNARLNWELEWAEIPLRDKVQFFKVVREAFPVMSTFTNDWATEAIVRQWMKNKRSYAVNQGFLEVKEKWAYLKENAAKRTDTPRGNGGKRKATSQGSSTVSKKARLAKTATKGKATANKKSKKAIPADADTTTKRSRKKRSRETREMTGVKKRTMNTDYHDQHKPAASARCSTESSPNPAYTWHQTITKISNFFV